MQVKPWLAGSSTLPPVFRRCAFSLEFGRLGASARGRVMITLGQLFIALPVGVLLLWGAYYLHEKMFSRAGETGSGLGIMVLVVMAGMALLLALTLAMALG